MAILNTNLSGYQVDEGFAPVPPGDYQVTVIDSSVALTKSQRQMLKVTYEINGPTHAGRKVFDNFLLNHPVALARLKSLATFGGHHNPDFIQDTEELHGLNLTIRVGIKEDPGYDPKNVVTSFKPLEKSSAMNAVRPQTVSVPKVSVAPAFQPAPQAAPAATAMPTAAAIPPAVMPTQPAIPQMQAATTSTKMPWD